MLSGKDGSWLGDTRIFGDITYPPKILDTNNNGFEDMFFVNAENEMYVIENWCVFYSFCELYLPHAS